MERSKREVRQSQYLVTYPKQREIIKALVTALAKKSFPMMCHANTEQKSNVSETPHF
jgi:hypothetical protein